MSQIPSVRCPDFWFSALIRRWYTCRDSLGERRNFRLIGSSGDEVCLANRKADLPIPEEKMQLP